MVNMSRNSESSRPTASNCHLVLDVEGEPNPANPENQRVYRFQPIPNHNIHRIIITLCDPSDKLELILDE
jgi:hypothetical protein